MVDIKKKQCYAVIDPYTLQTIGNEKLFTLSHGTMVQYLQRQNPRLRRYPKPFGQVAYVWETSGGAFHSN